MKSHAALLGLSPILVAIAVAGCNDRIEVQPTSATEELYRDQIDFDSIPPETLELYERTIDGSLAGSDAGDVQHLLDTAQQITDGAETIRYEFQLTFFDRPYEELYEEGVPFLFVCVQKEYGYIYWCDAAAPEF